ncbi:MAG: hypothetical protein WC519_03155 [Parcubacteria group bacterium]
MRHFVFYVPGFGNRATSRGLFLGFDKVFSIPTTYHILADYNGVTEDGRLLVTSLLAQAQKLGDVIKDIKPYVSGSTVHFVAHSQGCEVVALLVDQKMLRVPILMGTAILLAPPKTISVQDVARMFERPGAELNLEGYSFLPRADGSMTVVSSEYWSRLINVDCESGYGKLAAIMKRTIIVNAGEDKCVEKVEKINISPYFRKRTEVIVKEIPGADHNFTGDACPELMAVLEKLMKIE